MKDLKSVFICSSTILVLFLGIAFYNLNIYKNVTFPSNIKEGIERYWGVKLSIKAEKDIEYNGKTFKLILSTQINNDEYKYFNCYEQKMRGLYYKSYQAAEQGGSNALINFSTIFINARANSSDEREFTVVHGYNKDFAIDNYEIKLNGNISRMSSNIADKEYFIDTYEGQFNGIASCSGRNGSDMIKAFAD